MSKTTLFHPILISFKNQKIKIDLSGLVLIRLRYDRVGFP